PAAATDVLVDRHGPASPLRGSDRNRRPPGRSPALASVPENIVGWATRGKVPAAARRCPTPRPRPRTARNAPAAALARPAGQHYSPPTAPPDRHGRPAMRLRGKRVAYLVEEGFEDLEFWVPLMRLQEEGADVVIVGTGRQPTFRGKHCLQATPHTTADRVRAADFDAVVIPGGWAPDKLRRVDA